MVPSVALSSQPRRPPRTCSSTPSSTQHAFSPIAPQRAPSRGLRQRQCHWLQRRFVCSLPPANSLIENICRSSVRADQLRRRETIRRSWAAPALSRRQNSNQAAVFGALGPTASAQQAVSASCGPSGTPDPNNAQAVSDCNNAKQAQSAAFTGLQAAVNNYMPPGPTCPVSLDFL